MKFEGGVPYLTGEEMAEVDRLSIEELGMSADALMENAGGAMAGLARMVVGGDASEKRIAVLVGKGNNGGDGLVAARHLHNWGADVGVILAESEDRLRDQAARQFTIVRRMGVRVLTRRTQPRGDLIIDALLGYGSSGDPREPVASIIRAANGSGTPILAADIPSGLDATTGAPGDPCISAKATIAFGFPKAGFLDPRAKKRVGNLYVADISLPRSAYERHRCPGLFSRERLVKVW